MHDCARHGLNPVTMLLEQIAYPGNSGSEITNVSRTSMRGC